MKADNTPEAQEATSNSLEISYLKMSSAATVTVPLLPNCSILQVVGCDMTKIGSIRTAL